MMIKYRRTTLADLGDLVPMSPLDTDHPRHAICRELARAEYACKQEARDKMTVSHESDSPTPMLADSVEASKAARAEQQDNPT